MLKFKAVTYEEARAAFFRTQKRRAENSMKYWAKQIRTESDWDSDIAHDKASEAGMEVSFYDDVIKMLDASDKPCHWIHDINNLYGCSNCLGRETMSHKRLKKYCPNCGVKMNTEVER